MAGEDEEDGKLPFDDLNPLSKEAVVKITNACL